MKQPKDILFLELTPPHGKSVGGSFYSLLGMLELCPELHDRSVVAFYFDNHVARSIRDLGVEVRILSYLESGGLVGRLKKLRKNTKSQSSTVSTGGRKYTLVEVIWQYISALRQSFGLIRIIRETKARVVYCNRGIDLDRAAIIAALITRKKISCHLRGLPRLTSGDRFLAKRIEKLVAISDAVSSHYKRELGMQAIPIQRIYNPIGSAFEVAAMGLGSDDARRLDGGAIRVSCFSRIIWWKGQEFLIKAFKQFLDDGGNAQLHVYGDGPDTDRLRGLVERLGLASIVKFRGYANDVVAEILASDIVVNPSIEPEPLGRVIMEGMLLQRAVISTNIGGAVELIDDEVDGLLVPPNDVPAMSGALLCLCQSAEMRNQMASMAREKAMANWNARIAKDQFETVWRDLGVWSESDD